MHRPSQIASLLLFALLAAVSAQTTTPRVGLFPNYRALLQSEATSCGLYRDLSIVPTSGSGNGSPLIFQTGPSGRRFIGASKWDESSIAWTWTGLCTDSYYLNTFLPGCTCQAALLVDAPSGNTSMYVSCLVQLVEADTGSTRRIPNGVACTAVYSYFVVPTQGTSLGTLAPIITLSNNARGATSIQMTVTLTPVSTVPINGKIIITLHGAGMALPNSGSVLVYKTPSHPMSPFFGVAALSGAGPFVLTVTSTETTGNMFTGGQPITFVVNGFTNPTATQPAITNIAAATTLNDGTTVVGSSVTGTYPAILLGSSLGINAPTITLSNVVRGATSVTMSVAMTPTSSVSCCNGKIIITLSGAGMALTNSGSASVSFMYMPGMNFFGSGTAALSGAGPIVLTVTLNLQLNSFTPIMFTINGFTNPSATQAAITDVTAVTTLSDGTIVGHSVTGTYPAIV